MKLTVAEKFLLMAKHPDKGRFILPELQLNYGTIGAILMDLTLMEAVCIEEGKVIPSVGIGSNALHREIMEMFNHAARPRKIRWWIRKLVRKARRYRWEVMAWLEQKNVVTIEFRKFLGILPYRRSYLIDKLKRSELLIHLRNCALFQQDATQDDIVLLSLMEACRLHRQISSDRQELKLIRTNLKKLVKENAVAGSVEETIRQVRAAIALSMAAAAMAASARH